jgi:hypothetical protein
MEKDMIKLLSLKVLITALSFLIPKLILIDIHSLFNEPDEFATKSRADAMADMDTLHMQFFGIIITYNNENV